MYNSIKDITVYDYSAQRWVLGVDEPELAYELALDTMRQERHCAKSDAYLKMIGVSNHAEYRANIEATIDNLLAISKS